MSDENAEIQEAEIQETGEVWWPVHPSYNIPDTEIGNDDWKSVK